MGKSRVQNFLRPPPPPRERVKHLPPTPLPSLWALQAPVLKLPQNLLCPPSSMAKTFSTCSPGQNCLAQVNCKDVKTEDVKWPSRRVSEWGKNAGPGGGACTVDNFPPVASQTVLYVINICYKTMHAPFTQVKCK